MAGGGNDEDVFGVIKQGWDNASPDTPIRWFTGDPDTDPWEWRNRVLAERDDIAYAKIFFRKSGFITRDWYPYFLSARRGGYSENDYYLAMLEDEYGDGNVSHYAKRVYEAIAAHGELPVHDIKRYAGITRHEKSKFEGALADLQARMYITICGRRQKLSKKGEFYSWPSSVYCTTEHFWGGEVFDKTAKIDPGEAAGIILRRIFELNPSADLKKAEKFIKGQ